MITNDLNNIKDDALRLLHTLRFYMFEAQNDIGLGWFIERSEPETLCKMLEDYIHYIDEDIMQLREQSERMQEAVKELVKDDPHFIPNLFFNRIDFMCNVGVDFEPSLFQEQRICSSKEKAYDALKLMAEMGFLEEEEFHYFKPVKYIMV